MYNSAAFINAFYSSVLSTMSKMPDAEYELVMVDDGSPDNSLAKACEISKRDPNVVILELSRNFGHHNAIMAGLEHTTGDYIFYVDSDLEEKPELLIEFFTVLKDQQVDVVYGIQETRNGSWFSKLTGRLFYRMFNYLSDIKIRNNTLNVRLMTQDYVKSLLLYREKTVFLAGIWASVGYKQYAHSVTREEKEETTYTIRKRIALMVAGISAFSKKPLVMVFYLGMFVSLTAFLFIIHLFYKYFHGIEVPGYMSTIASIWLLGGLMLLSQGIIAIYLSKIFEEAKDRPRSIVKAKHMKGD